MAKRNGFIFLNRGRTEVAPKVVARTSRGPAAPRARAVGFDEIARRAFELYERDGRPADRQLEHWLAAERELGLRDPI